MGECVRAHSHTHKHSSLSFSWHIARKKNRTHQLNWSSFRTNISRNNKLATVWINAACLQYVGEMRLSAAATTTTRKNVLLCSVQYDPRTRENWRKKNNIDDNNNYTTKKVITQRKREKSRRETCKAAKHQSIRFNAKWCWLNWSQLKLWTGKKYGGSNGDVQQPTEQDIWKYIRLSTQTISKMQLKLFFSSSCFFFLSSSFTICACVLSAFRSIWSAIRSCCLGSINGQCELIGINNAKWPEKVRMDERGSVQEEREKEFIRQLLLSLLFWICSFLFLHSINCAIYIFFGVWFASKCTV